MKPGLIRDVRASLLKSIVRLLVKKQKSAERNNGLVGYVDRVLCNLKPGDTIITFNSDILLQRRIHKRVRAFKLCPRGESEDIAYLKLHGSIDWYRGAELYYRNGLTQNVFEVVYRQLYKAPWAKVGIQGDKHLSETLTVYRAAHLQQIVQRIRGP